MRLLVALCLLNLVGMNTCLPMYSFISDDDDDNVLKNNYINYLEEKRENEIL